MMLQWSDSKCSHFILKRGERGMEEAHVNGKELSHSVHAKGMNE